MFELPTRLMSDNAMVCVEQASDALAKSAEIDFVVNARWLAQFDSSALAVLLDLRRRAASIGKRIVVHSVQPRLIELASLYGVSKILGFIRP